MSPTATHSPLLSFGAAAKRVGPEFKARQVKWWCQRGWLTPVRIGQRTYVRQDELDRFLAEAEGAPHPRHRKSEAS